MDLLTRRHAGLIALVQQQQALITELQATVTAQAATMQRLEQRVRELEGGFGPPRGMPGHKRDQSSASSGRPRCQRATGAARPRSEPTTRVMHGLDTCPDCGLALAGGSVRQTREVIEITLVPATVTEHAYLERCCPGCGKRWTPAVNLAGQIVEHSQLGVGLADAAAFTARGVSKVERRAVRHACEAALWTVCAPFATDETAPQARLCRRIDKYRHALFSFVREPGVPAHNNAAERSVRHEVISRKISGGTRSADGTRTRTALATLFGTWRLQGCDPFSACYALLASPQV